MVYDAVDQLRHELKTPLTTIAGHAYLLTRRVRRASSLSDGEQGRMLDGVAAIEEAVRAMVVMIDGVRGTSTDPP
jgi:signal transduction histidine kinase